MRKLISTEKVIICLQDLDSERASSGSSGLGPLHGIPVSIKECISIKVFATHIHTKSIALHLVKFSLMSVSDNRSETSAGSQTMLDKHVLA